MTYSFQRLNHSLRADHPTGSTCVLAVTLLSLTAWVIWAVQANIPRYEVSGSATLAISPLGHPQLLAEFASSAVGKLHPGQPALFRPRTRASLLAAPTAVRLSRVDTATPDGHVKVEFLVAGAQHWPLGRQRTFPGSVAVEVESVTPAVLLLRSAGQLTGGH